MKTDTRDLISATTAARDFSRIATEASEGRRFVVLKNNEPAVAIVSVADMERLDRVDEIEDEMRMIAVALARIATDDGARFSVEEVAAELGIDLRD